MELSLNVQELFKKCEIADIAKTAKAAGFTAFDFFVGLDEEDSFLHAENYKDALLEIKQKTNESGIVFNQTHAPFRYSLEMLNGTVLFEHTVKALEISAILGAKICVVHPIHHMQYLGHEEEIFSINMEYYKKLLPYAKEYGVKIGVENMYQRHPIRGNLSFDTCSTADEFIRYIDTLDDEYAVACLDLGHVVIPDSALSPADFIRALGGDRLKALHVHDNDYVNDLHVLPYHGRLDWNGITAALSQINYEGDLTYEIGNPIPSLPKELIGDCIRFAGAIGCHLVKRINENKK